MKRDPLINLWQSSIELPERFDLTIDAEAQLKYFSMECLEFVKAVLIGTEDEVAEELTDVVVTMLLSAYQRGVPLEAVIEQFYAVAAKNDAKNQTTHEVRNKMIVRKN